jgi:heterodisulfide reductase subunit A-like polyferredoxin
VAISSIKRFVTDAVELEPLSFPIVYPQKIAIIGSGPAGISCAFELRKIGYEPTIFEALPVPGGMLSTAIPEYRLPTKVVKEEITRIQESGVKILLNTPIQDLEGLFSAGFSAIFIASGAGESLKLKIPGEDTKGVVSSLELLKQVKLGNLSFEPKRPVIIGGGNSAVDAARTLLRLGAAQVTICYRRSLNEMPALAWEIKAAQKEGIKIKFLTSPIKIIEEKGRVKSIICRRMKLGEPDQSGRRRPIPIPHSEQEIETDLVVGAIGERPSLKWLPHPWRSKLAPDGFIHIQPQTGKTKIPGIFAGGDVTTGPKTVIEAIAAGKNAAYGIHSYLQKQSLPKKTPRYKIKAEDIEKEKIQSKSRIVPLSLQIKDRIKNFNEVELGYDSEGVLKECQRCLFCAKCTECLKCVEVCQKKAIFHDMETSFFELQVGAIVIATGTNVAEKPLYEYGFKRFKNVITSLELERMMSSLGPTQGEILRPSDQKNPQNIGFVQCVGSRDLRHLPYCSSVCCMYTVKQAMIINEHYPHTKSFIFFTDIRAQGKEFQQYINRGKEYYNITYIRARPGQIIEKKETNNLEIWFEDTYEAKRRKIEVNLLVLCQPLIPNDDTQRLASILGITLDKHGFFSVRDPLSHPVDSSKEGIFICGTCEGPKDIPDSVIQASAVGFRVMESLNRLSREKDF